MKETELAQKFVEYLSCYDLYFEVSALSGCVDIVALNGKIMIAYEVKTSFNFRVIEQAVNNKKAFHSNICHQTCFAGICWNSNIYHYQKKSLPGTASNGEHQKKVIDFVSIETK